MNDLRSCVRAWPVAALAGLLLFPAAALAQTGAVAGSVVDETGGVLPGVTVEATSPALIEGVRSTVTDGAGLYTIEALRPGTYSVTFTLPGFSTFVREGIELTSDFTANVDAQMTVGSIEETITVSGASPVIDVQNVVSQETLSRERIDTLPTSKTYFGLAALTPGMSASIAGGGHDVGGSTGDIWGYVTIHGSSDQDGQVLWDGMSINNNITAGGGSSKEFFLNQAAIQEMVISTSDMNAEAAFGGVLTNAIPKEGGNSFSYYVNVSGTNGNLQSANVDEALEARGASPLANNKKIWDYGVGIGGPLVRDRIWFYTAHRWWGAQNFQPKGNFNMTPHSPVYTADPDRPAWTDFYNRDNSIRFTIQASERHKVTLSQAFQNNCACHYWTQWGYVDMDAAVDYTYHPINLTQASWTFPASNRLLFEAGVSFLRNDSAPERQEQVLPGDIAHVNWSQLFNWQAFGFCTSPPCLYGTGHNFPTKVYRASMSYVSGSHNFKAGIDGRWADEHHALATLNNEPLRYEFVSIPGDRRHVLRLPVLPPVHLPGGVRRVPPEGRQGGSGVGARRGHRAEARRRFLRRALGARHRPAAGAARRHRRPRPLRRRVHRAAGGRAVAAGPEEAVQRQPRQSDARRSGVPRAGVQEPAWTVLLRPAAAGRVHQTADAGADRLTARPGG